MIRQEIFETLPWSVHESELDLDRIAQTESVFALANGHIGLRGNLDEGEPHGLPGTYLNSVFEVRPLPYAEAGYGYPEAGQTVVNVTNGKVIRLLVDDEPLDVRYGTLHAHERTLDLRAGTLTRTLHWTSPAGRSVRVTSRRLVSFTQRAIAAISYEVTPVDGPLRVVVQSELVTNEPLPDRGGDPRAAAALDAPLVPEEHVADELGVVTVHRTRHSQLLVAAGMRHDIDGPDDTLVETTDADNVSRTTVATQLRPGQTLRLVKYLAYGWSSTRSRPAVHDQVVAALTAARRTGWEGLLTEQRTFLDEYWAGADVELDGDAEVQQAVRVGLFHVLQASARAERRPIPSKGLTGPGYDGHTFWDTESFVLPALTYTYPQAAGDALRWRHDTLPLAVDRAAQLGLPGAAFPWRTIDGRECSAYWPAGTAAFHINADIADAVIRYLDATDDERFAHEVGVTLLVSTARLWRGLGHHAADGRFRIDGVTGPDEYSAVVDNNVYTNLMAQQNLLAAADAVEADPELAERHEVSYEEAASWRDAAHAMFVPYDERLGVHPQHEGFTEHAPWDFATTKAEHYPLLLHFPYFDLYRKQVVKQADLVLALHLRDDAFEPAQKARDFAYYEQLTVRDSSLSACTQAVVAADTGHLQLAHDYLGEAALMDLDDVEHNTSDGLHMASLAGAWTALVAGFGGLRARRGVLRFAPKLPSGISRLAFRLRYRGRRLLVIIRPGRTEYRLLDGEPMEVHHHGRKLTVTGEPVTVDNPRPPTHPHAEEPRQPAGREPRRRRIAPDGHPKPA